MQRQERIYDRTQSVRAALAFDTSPRTPPPETPERSSWTRQVAVVVYAGHVFMEVFRRCSYAISRIGSSCFIAVDRCYVRCFNARFPASTTQRRRFTPILALLLLLVLFTIVRSALSIPLAYYHKHYNHHKPTDDSIHAHILVDASPDNPPRPRLRGDTFIVEPWTGQCKNTVNGRVFATDSRGYTCKRTSLLPTGCCASDDMRYSCTTCDVEAPHCCDAFERCVSCCMSSTNNALVHSFLQYADPKHPVYGQSSRLTLFGFCSFRCRTSSAGLQHQNSYRSLKKHCYGIHRPIKELDVVNSVNDTTPPPDHNELRERVVFTSPPLELDPFYLGKG
ncbi:Aste57867_15503 [Aphanomyces stellatus]|uniref:SREBP regulating gene protein n=1 Tax=Aphanomyces stellatus TaxID=120398 RepID=A0A485L679_9STRA|nr:hypothetical protein As57867_015447 [Aphanomyces stellatus]VFT92305.1 Aste57867_15503 [Aphanomyces stellatus]